MSRVFNLLGISIVSRVLVVFGLSMVSKVFKLFGLSMVSDPLEFSFASASQDILGLSLVVVSFSSSETSSASRLSQILRSLKTGPGDVFRGPCSSRLDSESEETVSVHGRCLGAFEIWHASSDLSLSVGLVPGSDTGLFESSPSSTRPLLLRLETCDDELQLRSSSSMTVSSSVV